MASIEKLHDGTDTTGDGRPHGCPAVRRPVVPT